MEIFDIQATLECEFTLKRLHDMRTTYSQMQFRNKFSQHSSIFFPIWLSGWIFVYDWKGCGFASCWIQLNFTFSVSFEQGVRWHSGNYRRWIRCETRRWHDKNIQSNDPYRKVLTAQINQLASLAKWKSVCLPNRWLWVSVSFWSLKLLTSALLRASRLLTFIQLKTEYSLWNNDVIY